MVLRVGASQLRFDFESDSQPGSWQPLITPVTSMQRKVRHSHTEVWFYDSHRPNLIYCDTNPPQFGKNEVWGVGTVYGCDGTFENCSICNPQE